MGIRLYHIDTPIGVQWWLVGGTIGSGADGEALSRARVFSESYSHALRGMQKRSSDTGRLGEFAKCRK